MLKSGHVHYGRLCNPQVFLLLLSATFSLKNCENGHDVFGRFGGITNHGYFTVCWRKQTNDSDYFRPIVDDHNTLVCTFIGKTVAHKIC